MRYDQNANEDSELVFGIIGPIGCNRKLITQNLIALARHYSYEVINIGVSEVIQMCIPGLVETGDQYDRAVRFMDAGNKIRRLTEDNAFLAKAAAVEILKARKGCSSKRVIYLIDSIKHPDEVEELKNIYGRGFWVFAVHASEQYRDEYLKRECNISDGEKRAELIARDKDEKLGYGQSTREAFHLADFFLTESGNSQKVWNSLERFLDIIFGDPFRTPTFHEYAMFMAYSASIRSSDMSRQVGAVVARRTDIISTGANECPKGGGGSYWPLFNVQENIIYDIEGGRDYTLNYDFNAKEKARMLAVLRAGIPENILPILEKNIKLSGVKDITEYGRVVHAEMDALLSCARRGVSSQDAVLFCTTYPCHNCAKHIVSSGVKRVVYVEPYPKSKAVEMHSDSICNPDTEDLENRAISEGKVVFVPFVGVGPRQFINLFSLGLSAGGKVDRKVKGGHEKAEWVRAKARPRVKMFDSSYRRNEEELVAETDAVLSREKERLSEGQLTDFPS